MDRDLLHALSEADAIAASEQEVRDILLSEAQKYHKEVQFDGLVPCLSASTRAGARR